MITPDRIEHRLSRRAAIASIVNATTCASLSSDLHGAERTLRSRLGLVIYDCGLRRKWIKQRDPSLDLFEPLTFLRHCHQIGAGGMQASLGVLDAEKINALRAFADEHQLFIEGIVNPPKDAADVERFDAEMRTAAAVGAHAVRTVVMPGRRYEQFKSLTDVREAESRARQMLQHAVPIVTKHRIPLAVENHKDQRIDERIALYKQLACEYIGATVDTGNSFALLDDPYEAIEALAPFAFSVHLKDQGLQEYENGFLLGDIPLGRGSFDVPRIVAILKRAKPDIRMTLEVITRDPLKVPCLTERYWATLPAVPGNDLARTLRFVRANRTDSLPQVSPLPLDEQVELEDAQVAASLAFAREHLKL